jgi:hypothetical protein
MNTPGSPPPPLCFVLMPFGRKIDAAGRLTDFDAVYRKIIAPGVEQAGLEPVRADEEKIGGTIHKPMFERLMLCPYAVADITGANPNVFYELGIRHALRPATTAIVFLEGTVIPFDIALVRGISYKTDAAGEPIGPEKACAAITAHLSAARNAPHDDSPLFQLVDSLPHWQIDHAKADVFRAQVDYSKKYKQRLAEAVRAGAEAVREIATEASLENLNEVETGIIVDVYLSLRDVQAYKSMIDLYERMPPPLQRAKMIREQLGFALNREERFEDAEKVLQDVIAEFGPSSETNGLLGRIYKDRWTAAKAAGRLEARSLLRRAVDTYLAGFEANWKDAYPGVNALTLMELQDRPDPRKDRILPVVYYSVTRKAATTPDYWDYATLLELAVLGNDHDAAEENLAEAASFARHAWEVETTKRNLGLIRAAREAKNEDIAWIQAIENALQRTADALRPRPAANGGGS